MITSEKLIQADLATLRGGGEDAVILFMEMCQKLHAWGGDELLADWVAVAAPALPEKDRSAVILKLLCTLFCKHPIVDGFTKYKLVSRLH